MTTTAPPANTAQSGRIIELTNSPQPMFFSAQIGRDYGAPQGGWTQEREKATVMTEHAANVILAGAQAHVAPFCRVVEA